jgi:hypothetical protein
MQQAAAVKITVNVIAMPVTRNTKGSGTRLMPMA